MPNFETLIQAWLNEKMCPEILDIKLEVVECILDQMKQMEENLKRAKRGDFKVSVHNMEVTVTHMTWTDSFLKTDGV